MQYLDLLQRGGAIRGWEYEPTTFWFNGIKRGVVSYKPDFLITPVEGKAYWQELKGYLDPRSATKIKRFCKNYPDETLDLIMQRMPRKGGALTRLGDIRDRLNATGGRIIDGTRILKNLGIGTKR